MDLCPCGSKLAYSVCCEPFIKGKALPPTAEALMRARYSAYAKTEIDFIESTHQRVKGDEVSVAETRKWSEESKWLGLKIVSTSKGGPSDETGKVEFIAEYSQGGLKDRFHEMAEFKKVGDKWMYDKGTIVPSTIVREAPKVGRNDPCPCGSGKKYKHCCGK